MVIYPYCETSYEAIEGMRLISHSLGLFWNNSNMQHMRDKVSKSVLFVTKRDTTWQGKRYTRNGLGIALQRSEIATLLQHMT